MCNFTVREQLQSTTSVSTHLTTGFKSVTVCFRSSLNYPVVSMTEETCALWGVTSNIDKLWTKSSMVGWDHQAWSNPCDIVDYWTPTRVFMTWSATVTCPYWLPVQHKYYQSMRPDQRNSTWTIMQNTRKLIIHTLQCVWYVCVHACKVCEHGLKTCSPRELPQSASPLSESLW